MKQGTKANKTGNKLEQFIDNLLADNGYRLVTRGYFDTHIYFELPVYAKQYHVGKSIYDTDQYCDFIVYDSRKHPDKLSIEAKWQQSAGSVDEKYPYLILNTQRRLHKTIVVLDGGGYKAGAEQWIRSQANPRGQLIAVYSMAEFQKYANSGKL